MADERVCDLSGCSGPLMDAVHEHILTSGCVDALKVRLAAAERERDEISAGIESVALHDARVARDAAIAERDEARGLLREAQWPLGGNTMEAAAMFDLRARIAAHLGRSE